MKRVVRIVILVAGLMVLCTGCDFIRASLGKPTSADLNKISEEVKARERYLRDSIAAVREAEARLAAGDSTALEMLAPKPTDITAQVQQTPTQQAPAQPAEAKPAQQQPTAQQPAQKQQPAAQQPTAQKQQPASTTLKRYYAVAGAFKNPEGAQKYINKLQEKGLAVHVFDFRSGLKVVCIDGHESLEEAQRDVATLRELNLSDSDPWIYNTKQKLHI